MEEGGGREREGGRGTGKRGEEGEENRKGERRRKKFQGIREGSEKEVSRRRATSTTLSGVSTAMKG